MTTMKPNRDRPIPMQILISFRYAFAGLGQLARDRNMLVHVLAAAVAVATGAWLRLSASEWALLVMTITMVLSIEAINSAIEYAVDLASPEFNVLAGRAKDISAAAVLMAACGAVVVGAVLFVPKFLSA